MEVVSQDNENIWSFGILPAKLEFWQDKNLTSSAGYLRKHIYMSLKFMSDTKYTLLFFIDMKDLKQTTDFRILLQFWASNYDQLRLFKYFEKSIDRVIPLCVLCAWLYFLRVLIILVCKVISEES